MIGINKVFAMIKEFSEDETGAAQIEYALISSGVGMAVIGPLDAVGENLPDVFDTIAAALNR